MPKRHKKWQNKLKTENWTKRKRKKKKIKVSQEKVEFSNSVQKKAQTKPKKAINKKVVILMRLTTNRAVNESD
jgi:hypothetical protein